MIYQMNNQYYIKQGNLYYVADIVIKSHTIVVMPISEYVTELEGAIEISYQELKNKFKGDNDEQR